MHALEIGKGPRKHAERTCTLSEGVVVVEPCTGGWAAGHMRNLEVADRRDRWVLACVYEDVSVERFFRESRVCALVTTVKRALPEETSFADVERFGGGWQRRLALVVVLANEHLDRLKHAGCVDEYVL